MKKAIFRYEAKDGKYKNMGDYVQSIAARQFVGTDAVLLERDHLHEYIGEEVKLIMAAWWMHYPENWPPAHNIKPLFISFHITPDKAEVMLSDKGISYLKKYEPIGCRDMGTKRVLEEKGIKAYFSGCLTLTLGITYKHSPIYKNIIFVDPHFDIPSFKNFKNLTKTIKNIIFNFSTLIKISRKMYKSNKLKYLIKTSLFFSQYIKKFNKDLLINANYYTHFAYEPKFKNEQEKFAYTDELLEIYSKASFVVTSRLHVALPCIAMGVPTIFVQSEKIPRSPGRFEGLLEHVHKIEYKNSKWNDLDDFKTLKIVNRDFIFSNKNTHVDLAKNMSDICFKFVSE